MIVYAAGLYWLFLWVTAKPGASSRLKESYPNIPFVESLRAKFLANLTGVSSDSEGLVAGLAIGERGAVSEGLAEQMKSLSLTHLVAVSGANLAIVTGAIFFLLAQLGVSRNLRFLISYFAMAGYVLLVGPESSVIRSATMATFVLGGFWLGRRVDPLRMLALAVLLLLFIDPGLAVDFGFALSVFATSGLLVLATRVYEKLKQRLHPALALGISATFGAQLYTMPILLMLQPSIPVYSVLANLIVEPVVAPVTILGISAVVLVSFFPPIDQLLSFIASLGTWWITWVALVLNQLPMLRVPFVPGPVGVGLMVCIVVGVSFAFTSSSKLGQRLWAGLAVLAFSVSAGWVARDLARGATFAKDWQVLNCDVGQGDALLIRQSDFVALVDVGRDDKAIDTCLASQGISEISLLVLTHYDADHVAGIRGAVRNRKVVSALLSGFRDDRPLVSVVEQALAEAGVAPEHAFRGLQGQVGELSWRVLSPTFDAQEAQDSNDSSIVMLWQLADFNVLTTGDLGENGQQRLLRTSGGELAIAASKPLVLKVAHHGSADQSKEFHGKLRPDIALISVGLRNDYGHPTSQTLAILNSVGSKVFRTDTEGAIAISVVDGALRISTAGKLSM